MFTEVHEGVQIVSQLFELQSVFIYSNSRLRFGWLCRFLRSQSRVTAQYTLLPTRHVDHFRFRYFTRNSLTQKQQLEILDEYNNHKVFHSISFCYLYSLAILCIPPLLASSTTSSVVRNTN